MYTLKLFFFGLLLTSFGGFSQNYYGMNRDLIDNSTPKKQSTEEINKERNEYVDKYMAKLKTALNLDELQQIAIKNEIISNSKNIDIVMKKEDLGEDKEKEVKALMDKTEVIINSYLNKEQKEKYLLFKANKNDKKTRGSRAKGEQSEAKDEKSKKENNPTAE